MTQIVKFHGNGGYYNGIPSDTTLTFSFTTEESPNFTGSFGDGTYILHFSLNEIPIPQKEGSSFLGYDSNAYYENFPDGSFTLIVDGTTIDLYAIWSENKQYFQKTKDGWVPCQLFQKNEEGWKSNISFSIKTPEGWR